MIVNAGYRGKVGAAAPKFTYTGQYNIRKDGVVELLTSGTIVFLEPKVIDVFCVGGGGAGGTFTYNHDTAGGGGGGGYTRTVRRVSVPANTDIPVTVGAGGAVNTSGYGRGGQGGTTIFGDVSAGGGLGGQGYPGTSEAGMGGDGGSGGGGGVRSNSDGGVGGSNGGNGAAGTDYSGGTGQGNTTREFGEGNGKLYAGGGGGGRYMYAQSPVVSMGGAGGGGSGAWSSGSNSQAAAAGVANTGSGGGGGARGVSSGRQNGASGGSGIVCFRDAAELPELAGTWVLNARLYPSPTGASINENINYTAVTPNGNFTGVKIVVGYSATSTAGFYLNQSTTFALYQFSNNQWADSTRAISQLTFPVGATASAEFRVWLASNATKQ